jgi:hypothetical protein
MAENNSGTNQQTMMYVLIGVVVVLIAVVGFMIWQRSQPAATDTGAAATATQQQQAAQSGAQPPSGMGAATATPVDPKASTKVQGSPQAHVKAYYDAVVKSDWKTGFALLPQANKAQSPESQWAQTQQGYGIKSYKIVNVQEQGTKATVTVSMSTASYGDFSNQWTFEKVGGQWYVAGKKTMMGGQ